jgi:uncharacterized protein
MLTIEKAIDQNRVFVLTDEENVRFAILSDTHIPDRTNCLHPNLLSDLRKNKVDIILHCGDITRQTVLNELEQVAPVLAVLGNRDAFFSSLKLPFTIEINIFNKSIGMFHGFASVLKYFPDKLQYMLQGYHFEKYLAIGKSFFPHADVICFGHTHFAEIRRYGKQTLINPGTSGSNSMNGCPSWAVLDVHRNGKRYATLNALTGYSCRLGRWIESNELLNQ